MIEFINSIIELILNFINPIVEAFNSVWDNIKSYPLDMIIPDQNLKAFIGACINTFVPISSIMICIGLVVPLKLTNFVIACVIRVKSFIPLIGGS